MTSTTLNAPHSFFIDTDAALARWWKKPGAAATLILHALALAAIWTLSAGPAAPPKVPPVVELLRVKAEPPPEIVPPKAEPLKEKPLALAPPKPVAQPQPVPKTVAASADKAETYTPPAVPVQAPPVGPVTPVAPAPAQAAPAAPPAPPAAKVIATEGIPTDYVNEVYNRINKNVDYPREAKNRRQQGRVGYKLTLNPQGALLNVELQTSGNEVLDQAAREAIQRAAPFPKLPDLGGSSYLLAGFIVFKIN